MMKENLKLDSQPIINISKVKTDKRAQRAKQLKGLYKQKVRYLKNYSIVNYKENPVLYFHESKHNFRVKEPEYRYRKIIIRKDSEQRVSINGPFWC